MHVVDIADDKLPSMEALYGQVKDVVDNMQHTRQYLSNDIQALKNKISILDATEFSFEQDCKRKEQRGQEQFEQKERLEKLIANIQSNSGKKNYENLLETLTNNAIDVVSASSISNSKFSLREKKGAK